MELSKALPVFIQGPLPDAVLQVDHICVERAGHSLRECILPESRVYTSLDAALDTPEELRLRLEASKAAKPMRTRADRT
jgi:hypothetical protein